MAQTIGSIPISKLNELKKSGRWLFRTYDSAPDGLRGYDDSKCPSIGNWETASQWKENLARDVGGFVGQGPGGWGHVSEGIFGLYETGSDRRTSADGDKIAVPEMCLLALEQDALNAVMYLVDGHFPGAIVARKEARIALPTCHSIGALHVFWGARVSLPACKRVNYLRTYYEAHVELPACEIIEDCEIEDAKVVFPACKYVGQLRADVGAKVVLPSCERIERSLVVIDANVTIPACESIGYDIALLGVSSVAIRGTVCRTSIEVVEALNAAHKREERHA